MTVFEKHVDGGRDRESGSERAEEIIEMKIGTNLVGTKRSFSENRQRYQEIRFISTTGTYRPIYSSR